MNVELINKVALMQDALNEYYTENWKENRNELDFQIATNQEVAELIDTEYDIDGKKESLQWKWWKGASGERTTDLIDWLKVHEKVFENIKIELVDLLFFTLSQIRVCKNDNSTKNIELHQNDWENIMNISKYSLSSRPNDAVTLLVKFAEKLEFNLLAYYCAKHQLNYFRQLDGYKDGSYKKVIDGKEDNENLHDIIKDIKINDFDESFEKTYDQISTNFYEVFTVKSEEKKFYEDWIKLIKEDK